MFRSVLFMTQAAQKYELFRYFSMFMYGKLVINLVLNCNYFSYFSRFSDKNQTLIMKKIRSVPRNLDDIIEVRSLWFVSLIFENINGFKYFFVINLYFQIWFELFIWLISITIWLKNSLKRNCLNMSLNSSVIWYIALYFY